MSDFLLAQLEQLQAKDAKRRLNMKPVLWTQLQQAEPDSHIVSFGNSFYLSHLLERTSLRACLQSLRESGVSVDSVKSLLVFALTASHGCSDLDEYRGAIGGSGDSGDSGDSAVSPVSPVSSVSPVSGVSAVSVEPTVSADTCLPEKWWRNDVACHLWPDAHLNGGAIRKLFATLGQPEVFVPCMESYLYDFDEWHSSEQQLGLEISLGDKTDRIRALGLIDQATGLPLFFHLYGRATVNAPFSQTLAVLDHFGLHPHMICGSLYMKTCLIKDTRYGKLSQSPEGSMWQSPYSTDSPEVRKECTSRMKLFGEYTNWLLQNCPVLRASAKDPLNVIRGKMLILFMAVTLLMRLQQLLKEQQWKSHLHYSQDPLVALDSLSKFKLLLFSNGAGVLSASSRYVRVLFQALSVHCPAYFTSEQGASAVIE